MRAGWFGTIGIGVALAIALLAGCHSSSEGIHAKGQESTPAFIGMEKDCWYAVAPDQISATSELTLKTRPAEPVLMPIRLPYAKAQLKAVTLKDRALGFHQTGPGTYNVELPADKQIGHQRQITCTWLLPVRELKYESGLYWTWRRSLIPVVSYELRAGAGPQSGFEVFGASGEERPLACSMNPQQPTSEFSGECALPIRPRQ